MMTRVKPKGGIKMGDYKIYWINQAYSGNKRTFEVSLNSEEKAKKFIEDITYEDGITYVYLYEYEGE